MCRSPPASDVMAPPARDEPVAVTIDERSDGTRTQNTDTNNVETATTKRELFSLADTWVPPSKIGWEHHRFQTMRVRERGSMDTFFAARTGTVDMTLEHCCSQPAHIST